MNLDRVIAVRNSKTIYRRRRFVYQVFDSDYSKADILNEALNQARVEETGLNIPKGGSRSRLSTASGLLSLSTSRERR